MENNSLYGLTKGTPFEEITTTLAHGEAKGAMMYYALARMATAQGRSDIAEKFTKAGNQEASHSGFYAVLVGMFPERYEELLEGLLKAELSGISTLHKFADWFRENGSEAAANEIENYAKQEGEHSAMLKEILADLAQSDARENN